MTPERPAARDVGSAREVVGTIGHSENLAKTTKLRGRVVKLTLKRLKNGGVRHWTRLEFEPGTPYKSVALSGTIPAGNDPEATLLLALTQRYSLTHGLPDPRWA